IGDVALLWHLLTVHVQPIWIRPVSSLPFEADPVIEPSLRLVAVAPHVPLADEGRLVAGRLQGLWKERQPRRHRVVVVDYAMPMRVQPRQDRRPRRRAERGRHERILQTDSA